MNYDRRNPFPDAHEDAETARGTPVTPQTQASAYRLAYADTDFLCRDEMRAVRLQLELMKPELVLTDLGVTSTIVMFGGARMPVSRTPIPDLRRRRMMASRLARTFGSRMVLKIIGRRPPDCFMMCAMVFFASATVRMKGSFSS